MRGWHECESCVALCWKVAPHIVILGTGNEFEVVLSPYGAVTNMSARHRWMCLLCSVLIGMQQHIATVQAAARVCIDHDPVLRTVKKLETNMSVRETQQSSTRKKFSRRCAKAEV